MQNILGLDVGGTKISSGLSVDMKLSDVRTQATSQKDLVAELITIIQSYKGFEAIGIGMPGQVLHDGTVTYLPNVENFGLTNLKILLEGKFKVPVKVINDAKAFALAEAVAGAGKDFGVVAGVILGTGVGVGIVMNKQIYFGKDGLAGELEHISFLEGKMFRDYRHSAGQFKYAEEAKKFLKTLLDMVVLSFNPDVIVLGGAWSKLTGMQELANELVRNSGNFITQTPVRVSNLEHPGVIGAALSVLKP